MIKVGDVIDRYIIVSPLGQGGYATVWLARHQSLESLHALKILHVSSTDHAQRLMSEGRIQASLEHPHIVSVTDAIQTESGLVLVMPYVAGSSLAVYLENHRPSLQETQGLMQGVLEGLAFAHRHGVIHRDLKPANILLAAGSDRLIAKITDFGIARNLSRPEEMTLTQTAAALGTLAYMAPEQARSAHDVDVRADIFSFGCILYEMLTGKRAFPRSDILGIVTATATGDFVAPNRVEPQVPLALNALVCACLQPNPEDRPASCEEVLAILRGEVSLRSAWHWPRVRWGQVAVGVFVVGGVGALLVWGGNTQVSYPHKEGFALHLDGKTALMVPASTSLNLDGAMTLQAWVYPEAWQYGELFPILDRIWRLEITIHALSFSVGKRTGSQLVYKVPLRHWLHVSVSYNPSIQMSYWYLNGQKMSEEPYNEVIWDFTKQAPEPLALGAGPYGRMEYAQGYLDDVRIWARELSPAEVLSSARGEVVDTADLVGEWRFDEGEGQMAYDRSLNENHGVIEGEALWVASADVGAP